MWQYILDNVLVKYKRITCSIPTIINGHDAALRRYLHYFQQRCVLLQNTILAVGSSTRKFFLCFSNGFTYVLPCKDAATTRVGMCSVYVSVRCTTVLFTMVCYLITCKQLCIYTYILSL